MSATSRSTLADAAALVLALDRDAGLSAAERSRRLRDLVEHVGRAPADRHRGAMEWLAQAARDDREIGVRREKIRQAEVWVMLALVVLGLLAGALAALAAFYYDGSGRINVVAVLAVLVGLPTVFLMLFVLASLPARAAARLPGASLAGLAGTHLNPGRLGLLLARRLTADWREEWLAALGRMGGQQQLYGAIRKWAILRASQWFSLAFQTGAVLTAFALVVFSDLAFGWSTTLTSGDPGDDAVRMHSILSMLAAPWDGLLAHATPSLELVQDSRYYRAVDANVSPESAVRLGGWWRFVLLCMVVYGLLPRIVTTWISHWRLHAHVRAGVVSAPGLTRVLSRWRAAEVSSVANEPERPAGAAPNPASAIPGEVRTPERFPVVINWASLPVSETALANFLVGAQVRHAGGQASVEEDRALIHQLAKEQVEALAIAVKAWEPPLLELLDFIGELRAAVGRQVEVVVAPFGVDEAGGLTAAEPEQLEIWRRRLLRAGDPWLRVADLTEEVAG